MLLKEIAMEKTKKKTEMPSKIPMKDQAKGQKANTNDRAEVKLQKTEAQTPNKGPQQKSKNKTK